MPEDDINQLGSHDIYLNIKRLISYYLSKWYLLLIAIIIGGIIGVIVASVVKPKYSASLTFVLSNDTKTSGFAGLASQFGLDMGSSGGNDVFSGDNILTLFQSKKMIKGVLFKSPPGTKEILANIIVKNWEWDKKWESKSYLKNQFPFPNDPSALTPTQDSLINEVYDNIVKNHLTVARTDKKLSVYLLNTTTTSELFSCYLTKYLMDQTADFYISTKTSLANSNLAMLQKEADSLKHLLGGTISSNASEVDRTFNLNPALQVQRASIQKGQVNATVLGTAYGEVVKNLELAKINLQREKPLYQILDTPDLPLKAERISKLKGIFIGMLLALVTSMIILIVDFRKVHKIRNQYL